MSALGESRVIRPRGFFLSPGEGVLCAIRAPRVWEIEAQEESGESTRQLRERAESHSERGEKIEPAHVLVYNPFEQPVIRAALLAASRAAHILIETC